ncbi:hypothetical protein MCBRY_003378 [Methylocystis bryophila]
MIWEDEDRYALAYFFALVSGGGMRCTRAAILAALTLAAPLQKVEPWDAKAKLKAERERKSVVGLEVIGLRQFSRDPGRPGPIRQTATRLRNKAAARGRSFTSQEGEWLWRMALAMAAPLLAGDGLAKNVVISLAESVGEKDFAISTIVPAIEARLAGAGPTEIQFRFFANLLAKREG